MSAYFDALRHKIGNGLLLIPGVAAIIHDAGGRVLIQQRHEGGHSLPGGAIEPGEHPAQALAREVYEETGLTIRPRRLLGVFGGATYRARYANGDQVEYMVSLFACDIISGTLQCLDGESAALQFWPPDQVPPLHTEYPRELLVRNAQPHPFQWNDSWLVDKLA